MLEDEVVVLLVAGFVSIHKDDIEGLARLRQLLKRAARIANVDFQLVLQASLLEVGPDKTLEIRINLQAGHLHEKMVLCLCLL